MNKAILLLDDEEHIRKDLGGHLERKGYVMHKASSIEEAKKIIQAEAIDFAIVDLKIDYESEFSGIQVVNYVKRIHPKAKVIVLSAYHQSTEEIKSAIEVDIDGYIWKGDHENNYILAIGKKLMELENTPQKKKCFVIMPFSSSKSCSEKEWTDIFNTLIKPSIEKSGLNYECIRSQALAGNIIEHIFDEINGADLVIADLTDKNPNVFYELGVRHALRDFTILIAQNEDDIPFDLKPYATLCYNWKITEDRKKFKENMRKTIHYIETNSEKAISPVRKYLNL